MVGSIEESIGDAGFRLKQLSLTNFRCFEQLTIQFHDRLTVLVARNGRGKTAVLDALAIALGPLVGAFDEGEDRTFVAGDIRLVRASPTTNTMEYADGGVSLAADGWLPFDPEIGSDFLQMQRWERHRRGPKTKTTRKESLPLAEYGKFLQGRVRRAAEGIGQPVVLPLVAYYGTGRLWDLHRLPYKSLSRTSRMVGYTRCLESGSDFRLLADWFQYWSRNTIAKHFEIQRTGLVMESIESDNAIAVLQAAVNHCLRDTEWGEISFDFSLDEVVARHPDHGALPVGMLSDGIRSMLALVADLAFRAFKLNPDLGTLAAQRTPGIVLIDEVEMHLHPGWQQTVLSSLQEAFPRVQFVVTTHSPHVLTTVDAHCIRLLHQDHVETVPRQTAGVDSAAVLAEVMGVDPRPEVPIVEQLSAYKALINEGLHDSERAVQLRKELNDHFFGAMHPELLECDRLLRLASLKRSIAGKG
ncbi:AAA family ATPase [Tahibacter amnicola]|uniref:AAA family ATPase n=1 Tax=Tahibacter amnicola TaxID=2976241 RepID=A0ABY6BI48_9GAMM|nr:AAA family ATPase [Tahibacter amnicola]UXI69693.1 AAA family ATPase [Tahibacter amnicola]